MDVNLDNSTEVPKSPESTESDKKEADVSKILVSKSEMESDSNNGSDNSVVTNVQPDMAFKKPTLIDSKTVLRRSKNVSEVSGSNVHENKHSGKPVPQLPYQEPIWGKCPAPVYNLEVLKNGQIVSDISLSEKSYFVFGRMECCHVVMEHPSVSRFHAVLQYRGEGEDQEKGFYVYDLESTHGTFLNKQQLRPRTYHKMHVGHMLKLGGSSRIYILQGPEDDQEPEDELTVTELKAKRLAQEIAALTKTDHAGPDETSAGEGIDWGFGEDATEDSIAENPFAVSAPNEDLYLDDPKKTLRGWFEREGYELEYNVEEKGFGHFLCRIELPIDSTNGEAMFAEASVKGKKKEAVVAAALEACRILDRHGVLRQSQHDSRKRKEKDWESQDYYDSEEDTYLDRTGTIEKKRQFRKKLAKKDDEDNVETYDSLVEKLKETEKEIADVQKKLEQSNKPEHSTAEVNSEQDSLEAFMANLQNTSSIDKKAKSQLNLQLSALQQEKTHLEKLVKIAQPTVLPPLQTALSKNPVEKQKSLMKKIMPMTGAMKGRTSAKRIKNTSKSTEVPKVKEKDNSGDKSDMEEEEENDDDEEQQEKVEKNVEAEEVPTQLECNTDSKESISVAHPQDKKNEAEMHESAETKLRDITKITPTTGPCTEENKRETGPTVSPKEKAGDEKKKRQRRANHRKAKQESLDPDYSMWLPPDNQTGDGKTYLNDKFGY